MVSKPVNSFFEMESYLILADSPLPLGSGSASLLHLIVYRCGQEHSEPATNVADYYPQRGPLYFACDWVPISQTIVLACRRGQGEWNKESTQIEFMVLSAFASVDKNPVLHALTIDHEQNSSLDKTSTATPYPDQTETHKASTFCLCILPQTGLWGPHHFRQNNEGQGIQEKQLFF